MIFINHTEVLDGKVVIIEVEGPLNSETSPDFEDYTNKLLNNGIKYILLDAGKLAFVSSEGIGITLLLEKRISEKNGYFIMFDLPEEVKSLYEIIGFDKVFRTAETRIEAMQIMDKQIELREEGTESNTETDENEIDLTLDEFSEIHMGDEEAAFTETDNFSEFDDNFITHTPEKEEKKEKETEEPQAEKKQRFEITPFVVECAKCNSLVRVKKSGDYLCPSCRAEFTVLEDSTVIF